jgi:O-acetyl-ADP-ribose deacetylase (regulator of RNase III)
VITFVVRKDLFSSEMQTLVNPVNCVGVMGKGLALGFKQRFPQMFEDYGNRCKRGEVMLGRPYLWTSAPHCVLNFPTKGHWRSASRLDNIVAGLLHLEANYRVWGIRSMAVPALGCGEGGLDFEVVVPLLYQRLSGFDIDVELYVPSSMPSLIPE